MSNESFNGTVAMAIIVVKSMIEICPKHLTAFRESDIQILETIRDDFGPDQEVHIVRKEHGNILFRIVTDDEHLNTVTQLREHLEALNVIVVTMHHPEVNKTVSLEATRWAEKQEPKQPKQENQKMNEEKHSWKEDMKAEAQQKTAEKKAEAQAAPQQPSMAVRVAVATVKVATVAGLAYGAFRLYKHFTSKSETTEV